MIKILKNFYHRLRKKLKIDGKEIEVDRSEATEVELKNIKAKQPKVSKETEQEFFESWGYRKRQNWS